MVDGLVAGTASGALVLLAWDGRQLAVISHPANLLSGPSEGGSTGIVSLCCFAPEGAVPVVVAVLADGRCLACRFRFARRADDSARFASITLEAG